jgi:preprotein translocase subunit SecE
MKDKIIAFFQDAVKEMEKVTWPTRPELMESTRIVVVVSIAIAVFAWVVDFAVSKALQAIL